MLLMVIAATNEQCPAASHVLPRLQSASLLHPSGMCCGVQARKHASAAKWQVVLLMLRSYSPTTGAGHEVTDSCPLARLRWTKFGRPVQCRAYAPGLCTF